VESACYSDTKGAEYSSIDGAGCFDTERLFTTLYVDDLFPMEIKELIVRC